MTIWSDITHGCRLLLKDRGFTFAAALTLSLGIAVNVLVFTLLNGALLRDLPFSHPDRIVDIRVFHRDRPQQPMAEASYLDVRDWNAAVQSFDGIGAADEQTMNVSEEGRPAERVEGAFVSANGRRCAARGFLEFDHRKPFAKQGTSDAANIRLLCRAHNSLHARTCFGTLHIVAKIAAKKRGLGTAIGARSQIGER